MGLYIICLIDKWTAKLKFVAGGNKDRYTTAWESLSAASTDDWDVRNDMTNSKCEDQLQAFKLDKLTYPTQIRAYLHNEVDKYVMVWETKKVSMTTLLMHTVAHSTTPSFRPKTNNQPLKKFLSLPLS